MVVLEGVRVVVRVGMYGGEGIMDVNGWGLGLRIRDSVGLGVDRVGG